MATLADLERIAERYVREPYFRLLYVGQDRARRDALFDTASTIGGFESVNAVSPNELRQSATMGVPRRELRVADLNGCLIEVWDLVEQCPGVELSDVIENLPFEGVRSPQCVRFGLTPDGYDVRFRDFITSIACEFVGFGDLARCNHEISAWCHEGPPSLRMCFSKKPSAWLRSLKHDFFGNVVPLLREFSTELRESWARNDFWHDAVRNVLIFPFENSLARSRQDGSDRNSDVEMIRRIARTQCELIAPQWMGRPLASTVLKQGTDYELYQGGDDATACLTAAVEHGSAAVVIQDINVLPNGGAQAAFSRVPRVLVGEPEQRTTRAGWTKALSENVLGSFSRAEFVDGEEQERYVPVLKAAYWKAFFFVALPEVTDQILAPMLETYARLEAAEDNAKNKSLRDATFDSIAQVWCAKRLYFADSEHDS